MEEHHEVPNLQIKHEEPEDIDELDQDDVTSILGDRSSTPLQDISSSVTARTLRNPDNTNVGEPFPQLAVDATSLSPDKALYSSEVSMDQTGKDADAPLSPMIPVPSTASGIRPFSPVQMVLSTKGASWSLLREAETPDGDEAREPPRKKQRSDTVDACISKTSVTNHTRKRNTNVGTETPKEGRRVGENMSRWSDSTGRNIVASSAGGSRSGIDASGDDGDVGEREVQDTQKIQHSKDGPCGDWRSEDMDPSDLAGRQPETSSTLVMDNNTEELSLLDTTESTLDFDSNEELSNRPEVVRTSAGGDVLRRFNLSQVSDIWHRLQNQPASRYLCSGNTRTQKSTAKDASVANTDDNKVADVLSRVIDKEDFGGMEIVGQFNKGFIVARRKKEDKDQGSMMDDLFIVDQHAADEKYNFESLQSTTKIQAQKLFM
jgi:DNA mismatch repair protein PMS2